MLTSDRAQEGPIERTIRKAGTPVPDRAFAHNSSAAVGDWERVSQMSASRKLRPAAPSSAADVT